MVNFTIRGSIAKVSEVFPIYAVIDAIMIYNGRAFEMKA